MPIIFYIAGSIYIALPHEESSAICISSGVILLVYGIIKIVGYFSSDLYCLAFRYDLALRSAADSVGRHYPGTKPAYHTAAVAGLGPG